MDDLTPVPGFDGIFINEDGSRIFSTRRYRAGKYLSIRLHPRLGRWQVFLGEGTFYVHYLVAITFIGPRPEGLEVRHLDDDKSHNHYSNLAYGTTRENCADSIANGSHISQFWKTRTHCSHNHEYTPENTYIKPNGGRQCRACNNRRSRKYRNSKHG